jgi:hypothetical protein
MTAIEPRTPVNRGRWACVLATPLLALMGFGCAASPDLDHPEREAIAERHGLEPRAVTIRTAGTIVLTVRDRQYPRRTPQDRERLARQLAADLTPLHDARVHDDTIVVRFLDVRRSDVWTSRRYASYSYRVEGARSAP